MHLREGEFEKAHTDFFEVCNKYDLINFPSKVAYTKPAHYKEKKESLLSPVMRFKKHPLITSL